MGGALSLVRLSSPAFCFRLPGIFVAAQRHEEARPQVAPRAPTPAGAEDEDDDFDLDGSKQPPPGTNRFKRLRKGPTPTPQVRRCDLPDDEFIADGQHQKQPRSPAAPRAPASFSFEDEGDFFQRPELAQREMTPLKLLRKSPAPPHLAPTPPLKVPGYMQYFFHDDPRVRDLVSSRLQHFIPTGAGSTRDNEQSRGGSLSCRRQLHSSAAANDEWVTPRIPVPTDVGKRRVHARENQSGSGHWFTNDSGKRVYVSRNGRELTGRDAYRQYQKESGRGFSRYKKKGSSGGKGETRAKQSSSGTKRGAKVKIETAAKRKR